MGPPDSLVRPALEAAVAVARAGEDDEPVEPAPPALKPFLKFAKLPARALPVARRVLDSDDVFRSRVVDSVSEADVGRPGWIYLSRPPGWEEELAVLAHRQEQAREGVEERKAERGAVKRAARAEEAARRAEEQAATARAEAVRANEALLEERRARRQAVAELVDVTTRLASVTEERDRALEATAATSAALDALRGDVERLSQARAAESGGQAGAAESGGHAPVIAPEVVQAAGALEEGASAAASLSASLAAAAGALLAGVDDASPVGDAVERPPALTTDVVVSPSGPRQLPRRSDRDETVPPPRRGPDRKPALLPPAVFDDSREAADHLIRLPGVVVLVDGYNVSHASWPDVTIAEQRRRLVDALGGVAARTGAEFRVVFDGSDLAVPAIVPAGPRAVKVSFSPPGTEADDVILAALASVPAGRPLIVASSDNRVRDGARLGGANVISSRQLLDLLHR